MRIKTEMSRFMQKCEVSERKQRVHRTRIKSGKAAGAINNSFIFSYYLNNSFNYATRYIDPFNCGGFSGIG